MGTEKGTIIWNDALHYLEEVSDFLKEIKSGNIKEMENILNKIKIRNQQLFVINSHDSGGKSPLHLSIINNNIDVVEFLIDQGAYVNKDPNTNDSKLDELSPLSYACNNGNMEVINLLLQKGANVDVNAASFATENGKLDVVKLLLR